MAKLKYFIKSKLPTIIITLLIIVVGFLFLYPNQQIKAVDNHKYIPFPKTNFAVIADPHVFEIKGNIESPLYLKYGVEDRELLKMSRSILETAIKKVIEEKHIEFVIIPGDLTDSGDVKSHRKVAETLQILKNNEIDVYIIPGNHDGFLTSEKNITDIPRDIVTPEQFKKIYNNYGYNQAIYNDNSSLSYVVEPVKGLWLVMIDSCIYNSEESYHICDGKIRESTVEWIDRILNRARIRNKAVIGCLHHSLLEHYKGHEKYFSKYIVNDWEKLSQHFASQNMKIVFTGHHHAQDIVKKDYETENKSYFLYDIETSSLIGYPNAYRTVEITEMQEMKISSHYIKELPNFNNNFTDYTKNYVKEKIKNIASDKLKNFYLNQEDKDKITERAAEAMLAHYKGNELLNEDIKLKGIDLWSRIIYAFHKGLIYSLWNDLEPDDLEIKIDLKNGNWTKLK